MRALSFVLVFTAFSMAWAAGGRTFDVGLLSGPLILDRVPDLEDPITLHTIKFAWNGAFQYEARLGFQALPLGYFLNPSVSLKAEITDGDLIWYSFIGADLYNWKNSSSRYHFSAGLDFGAGVYVSLTPSLKFCSEIKTNLSPGTSIYWGNGIEWFFGGSGK